MLRRPEPAPSFVRPWWWLLLGLWVASAVLAPRRALASSEPLGASDAGWSLAWEAPEPCPNRDDLAALILAYLPELGEPSVGPELGEPSAGPELGALRVRAQLVEDGGGWTVALDIDGLESPLHRRFSAPACAELATATALVVAVSLDPVVVSSRVERRPDPGPKQLPEPDLKQLPDPGVAGLSDAPAPSQPSVPGRAWASTPAAPAPRPERARAGVRVGVGLRAGAGWGPSSALYGHLGAGLGVYGKAWAWRLEGGAWLPRRFTLDDGRAARIYGWWLQSAGCWLQSAGALSFPLCAGLEAGQAIGQGLSPTPNPRREALPWLALVPSVGLRWQARERLALVARAELPVGLIRARFRIGGEPLEPLTAVGVRSSLGLELSF